eukprot:TRINITY_DN60191_c0_g1_i1.p2 TRINITY_DN60191_c0_g1~~TRINITY_DN60191_c0_g1_i1.p2  ORF type:complete len:108 (-),score=18.45 TRINITY_DN60191_c0_g1_i1:62-385(-)
MRPFGIASTGKSVVTPVLSVADGAMNATPSETERVGSCANSPAWRVEGSNVAASPFDLSLARAICQFRSGDVVEDSASDSELGVASPSSSHFARKLSKFTFGLDQPL